MLDTFKVLTVDWDYFFSDVEQFDWGHRESHLFMDILWPARYFDRSLATGQYAHKLVKPSESRLASFWDKVLLSPPPALAITESHGSLFTILKVLQRVTPWKALHVTNFDQHHDTGYENDYDELDCGNWVRHCDQKLKLEYYKLMYPGWRANTPESILHPTLDYANVQVTFGWPQSYMIANRYDLVHVCRSSAWTPSWHDGDWLRFIHKLDHLSCWKDKILSTINRGGFTDVLQKRPFDLAAAKAHHNEMKKYFQTLEKKGTNE